MSIGGPAARRHGTSRHTSCCDSCPCRTVGRPLIQGGRRGCPGGRRVLRGREYPRHGLRKNRPRHRGSTQQTAAGTGTTSPAGAAPPPPPADILLLCCDSNSLVSCSRHTPEVWGHPLVLGFLLCLELSALLCSEYPVPDFPVLLLFRFLTFLCPALFLPPWGRESRPSSGRKRAHRRASGATWERNDAG